MQYPLSTEEHAALLRCLSTIRTQLQEAADLFIGRYGNDSSIAEAAAKALESSTLLEHELLLLERSTVEPTPRHMAAAY